MIASRPWPAWQPGPRSASRLIASCDLKVVAPNIDVEKAKPVDQGPTYDELSKVAVKLVSKIQGSTLFAAVAKLAPADAIEMPSAFLMEMHAHLMKIAEFGCGFNKKAI